MNDGHKQAAEKLTVLLVDDHLSFAQALEVVLNLQPDMRVTGIATTARDAIAKAESQEPDVILMDYHLPDENGAVATATIKKRNRASKVVMLTASAEDEVIVESIEAGASGYLKKEQAIAEVADTVRKAHAGDILVPPASLRRLIAQVAAKTSAQQEDDRRLQRLTPRESSVLQEIAIGGDDASISARMGISPLTFRTHVRNVMGKLDVHSRLEAITLAIRSGMIKL
jgi:DNA-binding NarL/FixJ family response regulator